MNKSDFIELVQLKGSYKTKNEAEIAIKAFINAISTALVKREDVSLFGFGGFTSALKKGKSGKVPGTDKTYTTQDKMIPKFKAGKSLKDSVASGEN